MPSKSSDPAVEPLPERSFLASAWPFLVAVAIVAIALITILIMHLVKPASERLNDSSRITRTLNDYYGALSDVDYEKYRGTFCSGDLLAPGFPDQAKFTAENQALRDKNGQIKMEDPTEINVNGNVATANSHWNYNKSDTRKRDDSMTFLKQGNDWKVCKSAPRSGA